MIPHQHFLDVPLLDSVNGLSSSVTSTVPPHWRLFVDFDVSVNLP